MIKNIKNKAIQIFVIATAAFTSSLLTAAAGYFYVLFYVVQPFQKEAVDNGFATWEVVDNATGATEFAWYLNADVVHNTLDNIEDLNLNN